MSGLLGSHTREDASVLPGGQPGPSKPNGVYHWGMLEKRGQHLFAGFDDRFFVLAVQGFRGCLRWYSSQAAYAEGEEAKGQIWTDEVLDVQTHDTHPRTVEPCKLMIVQSDESRELRTANPTDCLIWLKHFAIERVDRSSVSNRSLPAPEENAVWRTMAKTREAEWQEWRIREMEKREVPQVASQRVYRMSAPEPRANAPPASGSATGAPMRAPRRSCRRPAPAAQSQHIQEEQLRAALA